MTKAKKLCYEENSEYGKWETERQKENFRKETLLAKRTKTYEKERHRARTTGAATSPPFLHASDRRPLSVLCNHIIVLYIHHLIQIFYLKATL